MNPLYEKDSTSMGQNSIDDYTDGAGDKDKDASNKDIKKRTDSKDDQTNTKGIIKKKQKVNFDAEKYIDTEPRLSEATEKKAVITFGRMNPPTVGHEKLLNKMIQVSMSVKGTPLVYLSKTQDAKKNPLSYNDKIKFAQGMFGKKYIVNSTSKTIIEVAKELQKEYSDLVLVVGSDRVREFDTLLNKYNGKDYTFNSIEVISAGERDPDSDGVDGMSASKMRSLAVDGDFDEFVKGVPTTNKAVAKSLYTAVRKGLGIREAMNNAVDRFMAERVKSGKVDPLSAMGKQKLTGAEVSDYYKKNPTAKAAASRDKNVKLGIELALDLSGNMNYAVKEVDKLKKNLSKHPEVQKALRHANESVNPTLYKAATFQERLKLEDEEKKSKQQKQQPGYYKDMAGSTADKRQAQFNKQSDMNDDDPKAYKPAPGDASAETKPSKHSNKFKKMFGEAKTNLERAGLKRPHQLLRQDNTVNYDYRFKMYRAVKEYEAIEKQRADISQQVTEQRISEIETIMEQTEFVNEASNPEKSLKKKAAASGMPYGILKKVFDRGVAAWRTGHRPGTTPVQWGLARVNSFATKSSGTWGKADKDLADKVNG